MSVSLVLTTYFEAGVAEEQVKRMENRDGIEEQIRPCQFVRTHKYFVSFTMRLIVI